MIGCFFFFFKSVLLVGRKIGKFQLSSAPSFCMFLLNKNNSSQVACANQGNIYTFGKRADYDNFHSLYVFPLTLTPTPTFIVGVEEPKGGNKPCVTQSILGFDQAHSNTWKNKHIN